jgi:hypothetical protein
MWNVEEIRKCNAQADAQTNKQTDRMLDINSLNAFTIALFTKNEIDRLQRVTAVRRERCKEQGNMHSIEGTAKVHVVLLFIHLILHDPAWYYVVSAVV